MHAVRLPHSLTIACPAAEADVAGALHGGEACGGQVRQPNAVGGHERATARRPPAVPGTHIGPQKRQMRFQAFFCKEYETVSPGTADCCYVLKAGLSCCKHHPQKLNQLIHPIQACGQKIMAGHHHASLHCCCHRPQADTQPVRTAVQGVMWLPVLP